MGAKVFTRIYVKIGCDEFPDDDFAEGKLATGDEIFDFLTRSVGYAIDPDTKEPLQGDYAIWFLGTAEKFGVLSVNEVVMEWGFGESNWDLVLLYLRELNDRSILTVGQYVSLISIVEVGMKAFDDMYEIPKFLQDKRNGIPWTKTKTNTKENMKKAISHLKQSMEAQGYRVIVPLSPTHPQQFNE